MHIPDGYLDPTLSLVFTIIALAFIIPGLIQAKKYLGTKAIPLFAVLTAGVFAFQMLNFPIVGGTSGHLVGATLISIFLGPFGALISMSIILLIQAFVFADGGVTALGANIFNMGVIGGFVGYYVYLGIRKLVRKGNWGIRIGAAVGSYLAIVLAALACGLEIGWSYTFPYGVQYTVPAMVGWHLIIGVGEAIITVVVIEYVLRVRPDLLELPKIGLKKLLSWRAEEIGEASAPAEKKERKNSKKGHGG
ncbi:MAG: energy-coupling factor ABC transporter permease [Candidatus Freyarchaeota archaeon]|nr:energy-coupling factor ABC transporter permease [Candidatus Jordarchaeia archaeon]MBS7269134.1 energy-coupling factor ABC transporter permease [Candidatus Jordarchaeia archaeon]MBS7279165.1 energy-coupling factor ABC transporter permease [Candidatus Jordarchaeia archaeon]